MSQLTFEMLKNNLSKAKARWVPEETRVARLSDETRKRMLGAEPSKEVLDLVRQMKLSPPQAEPTLVARSANWRSNGNVSPVQHQGTCGSCVSFGCVALIESMAHIQHNVWNDLSEADSHFCSNHGASCSGWWPDKCIDEAIRRGVVLEEEFPYASGFPSNNIMKEPQDRPICKLARRSRSVTYAVNRRTQTTLRAMKAYLAKKGTLVGCMDVYTDFFNYSSGIYHHVSGELEGGHCMLVVGFSDEDGCWIVKNSWGDDWGEQGFARIAYSDFLYNRDLYPMYGVSNVILPAKVWLDRQTALEHPNGKVYFFKGDRYQRYNFNLEQIDKDHARIGIDGWRSVWTNGIDAALVHPRNGKAYFFRGDRYQRFNFKTDRIDKDNARIGIDGWRSVWTNGIDAALVHPRNGKAYFFRGDRYQRFNFKTDRIDKDNARIGIDGW